MGTAPIMDDVRQTADGPVQGRLQGQVRSWRGIPYAAPPVGDLRLRDPRPVAPWTQVLRTAEYGPVPPQRRVSVHLGAGRRTPISEDCLTLNVVAPAQVPAAGVPVVVWLYGGAFTAGAASVPGYRGEDLVRRGDVVYVSLNYRLGALGFMDFRRFGTPERPFDSNLGLKDQVAALRWVRRNISVFGGDPENVTVAGESAGGISVSTLMCVPAAAGLFHRGFALSTSPSSALDPEQARRRADRVLRRLGVDPEDGDAVARTLATAPWQSLVQATAKVADTEIPDLEPGTLTAAPVVDGTWLPEDPIKAFRSGRARQVPLVLGTMASEGTLFDRFHDILPTSRRRMSVLLAGQDPEVRTALQAAYAQRSERNTYVEMGGDYVFRRPSVAAAEAHSRRADTWMYRFDFAPRLLRLLGLGPTHGSELPALFGTYGEGLGRFLTSLGGRGTARNVSTAFQGAFLRFARTGNPGPMWPSYTPGDRRTRIFDARDRIDLDPEQRRRLAWAAWREAHDRATGDARGGAHSAGTPGAPPHEAPPARPEATR